MSDAPLITTPADLAVAVERARRAEAAALDTEFVWERTYYPRLGLIQLGLDERDVVLIDVPAVGDLSALGALLADEAVVKVLHDAGQDLTLLARATGALPRAVFDTQRAAGFVGLPSTISLQDLIRETAGLTLPKGETRTDWMRRPLTDKQIDYAADDVRYLPAARADLLDRAERRGRADWVHEEMALYDNPALYAEGDPYDQGDRVRGATGRLSPTQRAVLREAAAWREREARRSDRPRRHVLPDEALLDLAARTPTTPEALARVALSPKARDRYSAALLDVVRAGLDVPADARPSRGRPSPDEERINARALVAQAFVAGRCAVEGIDPALVATKAEIKALVSDEDADSVPSLVAGWRRTFIGDDLLRLLGGDAALRLDGPDGWPALA